MKVLKPYERLEDHTHRKCSHCKAVKPLKEFRKYKSKTKRGWAYYVICKPCVKKYIHNYSISNRERRNKRLRIWRKKNPERAKLMDHRRHYKNTYGLTIEQVEKMIAKYNGCCYICRRKLWKYSIDHDHKTGKVRGILCYPCNGFLGSINDDIKILKYIIKYLKGKSE
ncbi:MAG: endonuclease VII domain-containing protein [Candidatus Paceibacterota bacterium]